MTEKDVSMDAKCGAVKCWRDQSCLKKGQQPLCPAQRCISTTSLAVKMKADLQCPNCISFGYDRHVCTCSVRNELFRQHGL